MSSVQATSSPVDAGVRTLADLFAWRAGRTPAALAYRAFGRAAGAWVDFSWAGVRDLFRSFLPLSHTFERMVGCYLSIAARCYARKNYRRFKRPGLRQGCRPVRHGHAAHRPRWRRMTMHRGEASPAGR